MALPAIRIVFVAKGNKNENCEAILFCDTAKRGHKICHSREGGNGSNITRRRRGRI